MLSLLEARMNSVILYFEIDGPAGDCSRRDLSPSSTSETTRSKQVELAERMKPKLSNCVSNGSIRDIKLFVQARHSVKQLTCITRL